MIILPAAETARGLALAAGQLRPLPRSRPGSTIQHRNQDFNESVTRCFHSSYGCTWCGCSYGI